MSWSDSDGNHLRRYETGCCPFHIATFAVYLSQSKLMEVETESRI